VNGAGMRASADRGNQWFRNNFKIKQDQWNYYYLYALERYMSFQEIARGRQEAEPAWYNEAVDYMRSVQTKDGSFDGTSGRPCSTAFAVLFLTRSTQRSIGKIAALEANLLGGRDLPKDVSNVRQNEEGEVVKPQIFTDITKLVDALNDPNFTLDEEAMRQVMELPLDRFARDQDLVRMRKMVSAESPAARLVAVRALAQSRQLDNVPLLIYALSDGDNRIKREAEDGLRFISRKFKGFNLPDNPTPADVAAAQNNWKNWYLSIRPDAKFLD
jgi:hypothetical protein